MVCVGALAYIFRPLTFQKRVRALRRSARTGHEGTTLSNSEGSMVLELLTKSDHLVDRKDADRALEVISMRVER